MKKELHIGLCKGRHEIKTNKGEVVARFIFAGNIPFHFGYLVSEASEQLDSIRIEHLGADYILRIHLYITGFTPALTSTLKAFRDVYYKNYTAELVLMHYDKEDGSYVRQEWRRV